MTFLDLIRNIEDCFHPVALNECEGEYAYVANSKDEVSHIGYATNLNLSVALKAVSAGVDALITHHDAWDFLYEMKGEVLDVLKRHSISHCFIHIPLDAADFGNSVSLCRKLGLSIVEPFAFHGDFPCGRICEPQHPLSNRELALRLKNATQDDVRLWVHNDHSVRRIGLVTGAGNLTFLIKEAADRGCDTYITGETSLYAVDYSRFRNVNLLVGTHTHTEIFGLESLCTLLEQKTGLTYQRIFEEGFESPVTTNN